MALPPTIPTSFVPKQPVTVAPRRQRAGSNVFLGVSGSIVGLSVLLAAGVFAYEFYLKGARDTKQQELTAAQEAVNIDTVEDFIRLRNRLTSVESLLDQHVELSEFFTVLESKTLQTVRFTSLTVDVGEDRTAEIEMDGVARSFNALAAQSSQFAAEKRIKRAIFSDIAVNDNGTVAFSLTASIDPRLITSSDVIPGISEPVSGTADAPVVTPAAPNIATSTGPLGTTTPSL